MALRHGNPMRAVFFVMHEFVPGSGRFHQLWSSQGHGQPVFDDAGYRVNHAAHVVVGAGDADLGGNGRLLPTGAGGAARPHCCVRFRLRWPGGRGPALAGAGGAGPSGIVCGPGAYQWRLMSISVAIDGASA